MVWHEGERALQAANGVEERMAEIGRRFVRDHMPDQHRTFFGQLPFVVAGVVDEAGDAWATWLTGLPGFLSSPDPRTLDIAAEPPRDDPAYTGFSDSIGLLGIELSTRRRNRMNGRLTRRPDGFRVQVEHSFGNCPRYIQLAALEPVVAKPRTPERHDGLPAVAEQWIRSASSFYVASYVDRDTRQIDVSHRGGRPGFVRIDGDRLVIPDFNGNGFFNTLGNLLVQPRVGLTFVDLPSGSLLQMTGEATILELDEPFEGAERFWAFRPRVTWVRRGCLPLRGELGAPSRHSTATGSWSSRTR